MRGLVLLSLALALVSLDATASSRETRKRISTVEKQFALMHKAHETLKVGGQNAARDWRGRLKIEDIEQWAYTREAEERIAALLGDARAAEDTQANTALDEASRLVDEASARALAIANYWQTPSISWRARWKAFAAANELAAEPSDPQLLAAEQRVRGFLDTGDFVRAASASVHIDSALESAFRDAGAARAAAIDNAKLKFIPRKTPCQSSEGSAPKVGLTRAPSPENYYPPASRRRDEQGAIWVRAHVVPTNCGSEFAVVVSSGYAELDQAALRVAEDSTYVSATEDGKAVEGYLTFKVRFTIKP